MCIRHKCVTETPFRREHACAISHKRMFETLFKMEFCLKQQDTLKICHNPVQWRLWKTERHSKSKLCSGLVSALGLAASLPMRKHCAGRVSSIVSRRARFLGRRPYVVPRICILSIFLVSNNGEFPRCLGYGHSQTYLACSLGFPTMSHCRDTKSNEWHAQLGDVNSSHLRKRLCRNVYSSRPGFSSRPGLAALSTTLPDLHSFKRVDCLLQQLRHFCLHSFTRGRLSLATSEALLSSHAAVSDSAAIPADPWYVPSLQSLPDSGVCPLMSARTLCCVGSLAPTALCSTECDLLRASAGTHTPGLRPVGRDGRLHLDAAALTMSEDRAACVFFCNAAQPRACHAAPQ